jgi:signal transduction histidine kinase
VLVVLLAVLGILQYRWIGEVSVAERERLRAGLQASLHRFSQEFNAEVRVACAALVAGGFEPDPAGREEAYAARYAQWRESAPHGGLLGRVAVAAPRGDSLLLRSLHFDSGTFAPAEWPAEWRRLEERLSARLARPSPGPRRFPSPVEEGEIAVIELPRLLWPEGRRPGFFPGGSRERERIEVEWLIVELDLDYLRTTLFPELLRRHLVGEGELEYQAEIVTRRQPSVLIYSSDARPEARIGARSDASANLFDVQYEQILRREALLRPREGGRAGGRMRRPPPEPPSPDRGRWRVAVRHQAGSLEAVVNRVRVRNLAVTAAILLLMLATIAALVRFTQRAQKLAALQMEFVAGVSHELRTPLTVIRTAGHNLGGGVIKDQGQVQRYGLLIREEAERLTGIVEQVLHFAAAKAGRTIGAREPVSVESLIEEAVAASARTLEQYQCQVETRCQPGTPPVLADPAALQQALQNLLINAAKHGSVGGWIGVQASAIANRGGDLIEFRVKDRGPGIPEDELAHVFDAFYRGKKAIAEQIPGTGLGLSLVKRIVEAHQGTVAVESQPGQGAEFIVRIPSAGERLDAFADTSSGR